MVWCRIALSDLVFVLTTFIEPFEWKRILRKALLRSNQPCHHLNVFEKQNYIGNKKISAKKKLRSICFACSGFVKHDGFLKNRALPVLKSKKFSFHLSNSDSKTFFFCWLLILGSFHFPIISNKKISTMISKTVKLETICSTQYFRIFFCS
jgi:hypothetical protein